MVVFVHFLKDIAAANQLAVDVELRVGRPVAENLYLFANDWILENIDGFIFRKSYIFKKIPYFLSNSTTKLEYPHRGWCGVPFINSTTLLSFTHLEIIN